MLPPRVLTMVLLLYGIVRILFAQDEGLDILEDLAETSGAEVWEKLESLRSDPISLNSANSEELLQIPWIDPLLAARIITARTRRGSFRRLEDLMSVRGMTGELYGEIVPFLRVEPETDAMVRLDVRRKAGVEDLSLRTGISSGDRFTSALKLTRHGTEDGVDAAGYIKCRVPFSKNLRATAGDVYLELGQGLSSWSDFGGFRSPENPITYPLPRRGARGTTSMSGRKVIEGTAVSFSSGSYSLGLAWGSLRGGGEVKCASLAAELSSDLRVEASILAPGGEDILTSGMFDCSFGPGRVFTELVTQAPSGVAVLAGLRSNDENPRLLLLYRRFSHTYHASLGFDMSQGGSGCGNLEAFSFAVVMGRGTPLHCAVAMDTGRRIYTGSAYTPSRFNELSGFLKLIPTRRVTLSFTLSREREESGNGRGGVEVASKLRWDAVLKPLRRFHVRMRYQASYGDGGSEGSPWRADLFSSEVKAGMLLGLELKARITSYRCDEGGRLFIVEGGLPERSTILRLSGSGERCQIVVTKRLWEDQVMRCQWSNARRRRSEYRRGFAFEYWEADPAFEFQFERRF